MASILRLSALWSVALVIGEYAWAAQSGGNEMGNGGHVVACGHDGDVTTWEVLDVYETKIDKRGWKVRLAELPGNYLEKAERAIDRLSAVDPDRAATYQKVLRGFAENVVFHAALPSDNIPPYAVGEHCVIHLVAAQTLERDFNNTLFIRKEIWDRLDEDNKAALFIHEVVYWDTLRHGHHLSWVARYLSSHIIADEFGAYDAASFQILMDRFMMTSTQWHDEEQSKEYHLEPSAFASVEEAAQACARRGMSIIPYDLATSPSFLRFTESYLGRKAVEGNFLRPFPVTRGGVHYGFMSFEAGERRLLRTVDGFFSLLCTKNSYL